MVTKELGDGLMATFPSAGAAINTTVELQRQPWQLARDHDVPLRNASAHLHLRGEHEQNCNA